jgi:hypothetical protein
MRDDLLRHPLERDVAGRMNPVVMGIDEPVHRAVLRPLIQAGDTGLGRVRKPAVHDDHATSGDQVTDRASAAHELAHAATKLGKYRRPLGRLLLPGATQDRPAKYTCAKGDRGRS